jgi:trk system potassium uptake protein TrkA
MKVIIVGAGKVGFNIAATLSGKNMDVVVIDTSPERLAQVQEYLDVQVLEGNGASMSVLEQAGVAKSDLLIAVTELDELNMMTCFVGKSYGVKSTIARVRKPEYGELAKSERQEQLGIDLIVNPELLAAQELGKLVLHPEAHEVEYYADGRVVMLGLKMDEKSTIVNTALKDIQFPRACVIVGIVRGEQTVVPNGSTIILPKDEIFLLAATKDMTDLEIYLGVSKKAINNIAIFGGQLLGYYLGKFFDSRRRKINVKLFEEDSERCQALNEELKRTVVINGSGKDMNLMEDENIADMDVVLAVNDEDETNVMISIIAKHIGAKKVISQIRRSDYVNMIENFGIDKAVSPRSLMVSTILRFINRGSVVNLKLLQNDMAQMNEVVIPANSKLAGKTLKQLHFPEQSIIGLILRGDNIIIPNGDEKLLPGDNLLTFATSEKAQALVDYLA